MVNEVDDEVLPRNFRFINAMIYGQGVHPAEDNFRSGCSCAENGTDCKFNDCQCLADLEYEEDEDEEEAHQQQGTGGVRRRKVYQYHTYGPKAGLLRTKLHGTGVPLYECHAGCSCSNSCPNRVVERGRTIPLQIFRTKDRGWGMQHTISP